MSSPVPPARGEIWLVDLDPTRGHEQAGRRPAMVVSADLFNSGPAGLVVVLPVTTRARGIPWHVEVTPPDGGVRQASFIICEAIWSISKERFILRWGAVSSTVLTEVDRRLRILLVI